MQEQAGPHGLLVFTPYGESIWTVAGEAPRVLCRRSFFMHFKVVRRRGFGSNDLKG